jgi:hypothetical protein
VLEIKHRTPKGIIERKNLPKFGEAVRETDYRDCVSKEVAIMEYPGEDDIDAEPDPLKFNTLTSLAQRQETREREVKDADGDDENVEKKEREIEFKPRTDAMETTLRVSNLSKGVSEIELRELFGAYGKVSKVSLPRIALPNGTKEVRGFAYITYDMKMNAERAMAALDGRGYDHLILKLEWAKPPKDGGGGGGGGGGLSGGYVSGYGKQLAQDTKEKALFTSHGNSNSDKW